MSIDLLEPKTTVTNVLNQVVKIYRVNIVDGKCEPREWSCELYCNVVYVLDKNNTQCLGYMSKNYSGQKPEATAAEFIHHEFQNEKR